MALVVLSVIFFVIERVVGRGRPQRIFRLGWATDVAGLLPLWDIIFGTYYMPRNRWPENFGILEPMPKGYLGQLWEPFAWLRRRGEKVDPK